MINLYRFLQRQKSLAEEVWERWIKAEISTKERKTQGLETVCRLVALIYAQLQGKKNPSAFHNLVPLNAAHGRQGSQTWWKSFIFLAPMGEI